MRLSGLQTLAVLSLAATACDEPLTGPIAQKAYSDATARLRVMPEGGIVFVDDQRLPPGQRLDQLDPKAIVRIEVLKGEAAARLYGTEARGGVVRIYTTHGATGDGVR